MAQKPCGTHNYFTVQGTGNQWGSGPSSGFHSKSEIGLDFRSRSKPQIVILLFQIATAFSSLSFQVLQKSYKCHHTNFQCYKCYHSFTDQIKTGPPFLHLLRMVRGLLSHWSTEQMWAFFCICSYGSFSMTMCLQSLHVLNLRSSIWTQEMPGIYCTYKMFGLKN